MWGEVRAGRQEAAGKSDARSVQGRARLQMARGGAHTANILSMLVTLAVSKLSGWLNDDAACRVSKEGHTV